jgi:hypothetical protein
MATDELIAPSAPSFNGGAGTSAILALFPFSLGKHEDERHVATIHNAGFIKMLMATYRGLDRQRQAASSKMNETFSVRSNDHLSVYSLENLDEVMRNSSRNRLLVKRSHHACEPLGLSQTK